MCEVHKLKGKKTEVKYKAWRKKKYGYGYVTCKKTTYSCYYSVKSDPTQDLEASGDFAPKAASQCSNEFSVSSDNILGITGSGRKV